VALKDVEVSAGKIALSEIGKKIEQIDTLVKDQFRYQAVSDLLSYNTSVFVKNYGPGGLATTAFRGGSAVQTAVLWNGFNLQNAMLGQADLALMPAVLFEEVGVEYGGSSSLWGSGAVAGSIHLNNKTAFSKGTSFRLNLGGGSFGASNLSGALSFSKKRIVSSTKFYTSQARNNFRYLDTLDKEQPLKRQKDASWHFKGLMQEVRFLVNARQIISVNAWLNSNERRLPAYDPSRDSKASQGDQAARLTANWTYVQRTFRSVVRAAYFADRIRYADSLSGVYSDSRVQTRMLENENYFTLHRNYQLNVSLNGMSSLATAENYEGQRMLNRASLLLGNKLSLMNGRLLAYGSARFEYFSVGALPLTGNIALEYQLSRHFSAKVNTARVYRQPSLNELYWVPGGNVNLKPEQGYTGEGELTFSRQGKHTSIRISGSAYSRVIDNWILWVPGVNGNPAPVNLQKVWSRGTETTWKLRYQKQKLRAGYQFITGYVLSTVKESRHEHDDSRGKQLIYTPRYTVNGSIFLGYGQVDLFFFHQYSGYRFTTSDNRNWLDPYHLSSLRLSGGIRAGKMKLNLFAACNNLFNVSYAVMAGRPMPLRNYEAGISIHINQPNKHKQE
jgi:vitamin B12 transporter